MTSHPRQLLDQWIGRQLAGEAQVWWRQAVEQAGDERNLYRNMSLAARKVGKDLLALNAADLAAAQSARPGWDPEPWTLDQAVRIHLLLASEASAEGLVHRLDQLCATADVDELVALYRGLPLYPEPPRHRARAAEGLRSNMRAVFEAVAHRNPYPSEQLEEGAWNQMVLKALFVGSALGPIAGLDARANAHLARMLIDYARERWAARRAVSPELWRAVGPFATGATLDVLQRVLREGAETEREAVRQTLRCSNDPAVRALLF